VTWSAPRQAISEREHIQVVKNTNDRLKSVSAQRVERATLRVCPTGTQTPSIGGGGFVTRSRFSRRLQLDPGLEPPTSWSLLPLYGP
jgi:hypothetical protein